MPAASLAAKPSLMGSLVNKDPKNASKHLDQGEGPGRGLFRSLKNVAKVR